MIVDLIRHGEPVGGPMYRGHSLDHPLSDKGWRQMWSAVGDSCPWQRIISSPMRRCREFAEQLAERRNRPLTVIDDLREIGFGEWEGKTRDDLARERPEELAAFHANPVDNTPAGAEPVTRFLARITDVLAALPRQYEEDHVLLVGHAGVIRAAIVFALDGEAKSLYRIRVRNAGLSRIELRDRQTTLIFHDRPHVSPSSRSTWST